MKERIKRDFSIDILRFIALSSIVFVHIQPSLFWVQIRNFDVPLMVFLSGISYKLSGGNKLKYGSYCLKRFKRLILPVWFFLFFYFALNMLDSYELPPIIKVLSYYSFCTSWYIWIIRVFFVIALVAPIFSSGLDKIKKYQFIVLCFLFFIFFDFLVNLDFTFPGRGILLMNFPYIVIFSIGYKISDYTKKEIACLCIVFLFVYFFIFIYNYIMTGEFLLTQSFKYPPQIFYISYAMACTLFLWISRGCILNIVNKLPRTMCNIILFIGSHTIWIYLWHIPILELVDDIGLPLFRFILVYILSVLITYLQVWIIKSKLCIKDNALKKNIEAIFIG